MNEWVKLANEALQPLREAGLSVHIRVDVHGCGAMKNPAARDLMRTAQKACGVPKLKHNASGTITWWQGKNDEVELTVFDYLGPRCRIEEYEETVPEAEGHVVEAQPERVVRRRRVVCDEPTIEA